METLRFAGSKRTYPAGFVKLCESRILIISPDLKADIVNTEKIELLNEHGEAYGVYENYTTVWKEVEGGFILSNDGSVYEEPVIEEPQEMLDPSVKQGEEETE